VPTERLNAILQEIEDELTSRYDLEMPSRAIGDLVMEKLRQVDQVAYVRFASVYRDFKDVSEFVQEVQPILSQRADAAREKGKDRSSEDSRATGGD